MDKNTLLLYALCTFTSTATSALGAPGGSMLLAFMPSIVPAPLVIPLHGATQLISNTSRMLLDYRQVKWQSIIFPLTLGAILGAIVGYSVLDRFNFTYLPIILGLFILLITWTPTVQKLGIFFKQMPALGVLLSFLSLFVGAIGNIILPILLGLGYKKDIAIINQAAIMTVVHSLKLIAYGLIGFQFSQHASTLMVMMLGSLTGSFLGKLARGKINEKLGVIIIKWMTTGAAVYLLLTHI